MTLPNHLTTAHLEQLLELHKRREALQGELDTLDREIEGVYGGNLPSTTRKAGRPAKGAGVGRRAGGRGRKRVPLKGLILKRLGSAGPEGIKVRDLADDLGVNRKNVEIWFYTTGKKIDAIKKLGPGLFTLSGDGSADGESNAPATPRRRGAGKRTRGSTKERIVAALQAAGEGGISVKELSAQLGIKNQNLHTWFNQTGRKIAAISKVSLGRYKMSA